jgi:hypothetical protein
MPKSRGAGFGRRFGSFSADDNLCSLMKGLQRTLGKASAPSKFKPITSPQKMFGLDSAEVFSKPGSRRFGGSRSEEGG